jgi:hypothetical protein
MSATTALVQNSQLYEAERLYGQARDRNVLPANETNKSICLVFGVHYIHHPSMASLRMAFKTGPSLVL